MRTTIDINDAILRDLRQCAEERGRPFRQVVEEVLALGLARHSKSGARPRFTVKAHKMGLKPGFRGVSLNQLYDQIETERDATNR